MWVGIFWWQAFKLDVDPDDLEELEANIAKDVLGCELTKTEFAEILSMKPDSLFVEQMFELVDKDRSGTLSFREFLDVIVIFAKGETYLCAVQLLVVVASVLGRSDWE